jgi:hypothetical protein
MSFSTASLVAPGSFLICTSSAKNGDSHLDNAHGTMRYLCDRSRVYVWGHRTQQHSQTGDRRASIVLDMEAHTA